MIDQPKITIEKITTFTPELADEIRYLSSQIGDNYQELHDSDLQDMINYPTHTIFLARDDVTKKAAGMILVMVYRIPYVRKAYMDDLIIDTEYRKQGIATKLLQKAVLYAKENGAAYVDFTSRPLRTAGNNLYEKLGFKKRETNIYRLIFNYGEVE